jgi:hypothetical protein
MDTGNGQFACSECVADGDVNEDGVLTPADARCTFDTYLHDGQVSAECAAAGPCAAVHGDVDCDTQVLPGDALHIFDRWLRDSGPPHECFARRVLDAAETFRIGSSRAIEDGPGEVAISVERLAAAGNAAFAARVDFDPSTMEFVELRPTAGANWPGLAARSIEPGRLLVGGFAASLPAGDPGSWISVGDLIFRVRSGAADVRVEWKQRWITPVLPGVPESTNIPSRLVVGLPHPNPARGGTVALDVSVPAGDATRFEIQVVDVRGRIVRELHSGQLAPGRNSIGWDRKDARGSRVAAGLYVLRVRAGERLERRKLVVLE